MGQWVITVAGIAILSVLCDVIMPEGQTRKYIKTVVGIIVALVMLQPIINLVGVARQYDGIIPSNDYTVNVQQSYLEMIEYKENLSQEANVKQVLEANGVNVQSIRISKADKTVDLQVDSSKSNDIQNVIDGILRKYFDGYKISVKWK